MRIFLLMALVAVFTACPSSSGGGGTGGGGAEGGGTAAQGGGAAQAGGGAAQGGGSAQGGGAGTFGPFAFTMGTHNFSFDNYVNGPTITNLTAVELRRMFGDGVCAGALTADSCELTPNADKWMQTQNAAMNGGHCEGMAVLSALFTVGALKPSDFGASTVFGLSLTGNPKLQREIAYWWATQATDPARSAETRSASNALSPSQVADRVRAMVSTGGDIYTFGLYKRDGTGGHANNPIAVEDRGGKVYVKVYENNFPTATGQEVEIDPAANTWKYFSTTNPGEPGSLYEGDTSTRSLTLTPLSARLGRQVCPTCGSVSDDGTMTRGSAVSYREVLVSGDGHVLITDSSGKRLGYDGTTFVDEIAGASAVAVKRAPSTWGSTLDPVYRLPLGTPLTVTLDGTTLTQASLSGVTLSAPGYAFSVDHVDVAPGQKDTISFSAGTQSVTYKTTATETPTVTLAVTFDGADYLFALDAAAETGGVEVTLTLDAAGGKLSVRVKSTDGSASYDLRVERRAIGGTAVFKHAGNTIAAAATMLFHYGQWTGDGSPMTVGTDATSDGSEDSTQQLTDEP